MNIGVASGFSDLQSVEIRVRGTVQGVGFRPTVWRLAHETAIAGEVLNDGEGVLIRATATKAVIGQFLNRLQNEPPPLARIEALECHDLPSLIDFDGFEIVASDGGEAKTRVAADAAICAACIDEITTPGERRFGHAFANCTHCGPRLSIVQHLPYDRAQTTMSAFPMCETCRAEYENPADRRFHAQPVCCQTCGPRLWFETPTGTVIIEKSARALDVIEHAVARLWAGDILAIRGLGGFHLACLATHEDALAKLRRRKRRAAKPFALMARDLEVVRRYANVSHQEADLLQSAEAPIVILDRLAGDALPDDVAPGLDRVGFMLPYTPLHLLILQTLDAPLVMTSGNISDAPQATDLMVARHELAPIADGFVMHDRDIANRIDDSLVYLSQGGPRLLRRARGYAPRATPLPRGFEDAPDLLAYGSELKSTFCLLKDGAAVLSQHQGDLEDLATFEDYQHNLALYSEMFDHAPAYLVADAHPEYLSRKLAVTHAERTGLPLHDVQHHHAHIAACMVDNGHPLTGGPVLGLALDGLGYGEDGTLWGGELILADYCGFTRLARLKPVAMPGGAQAIYEPWRIAYAHIDAAYGWPAFQTLFAELPITKFLTQKPLATVDQMLRRGLNCPMASSTGRLFDAVAATLGLSCNTAQFEGQGAMLLETLAARAHTPDSRYGFDHEADLDTGLITLDPAPLWEGLFGDLKAEQPAEDIAARFHYCLAETFADLCAAQAGQTQTRIVALSGGCLQNRLLHDLLTEALHARGLTCLSHANVPANDGGLSLGQAAIAAARVLTTKSQLSHTLKGEPPCA